MRKEIKPLICISALVIMTGAIFLAGWPQVSSGQSDFALYQVDVHCIPRVPAASFTVKGSGMMGTMWRCAGACDGSFVTLDEVLSQFPAPVSAALRAKVDQHQQTAAPGKRLKCLGTGKEPSESKCEPPRNRNTQPPWLNQNSPCQDRQRSTYSWGTRGRNQNRYITVSVCGQVIRFINNVALELTSTGARSFEVCCDSWQDAVSSGSPCNPLRDIDCDGTLNEKDSNPLLSARLGPRSDDFVSNAPLSGIPFWKQLQGGMPPQSGCKECKWELVGVQYTCEEKVKRTGRRSESINAEYEYKATWKCPATGQTDVTDDSATMKGLRCPRPPLGTWP